MEMNDQEKVLRSGDTYTEIKRIKGAICEECEEPGEEYSRWREKRMQGLGGMKEHGGGSRN